VEVDVAPGQPFEAHFVDLNNDGKLEIIASAFDTRYTQRGSKTGAITRNLDCN
jgi:hypothetical protein